MSKKIRYDALQCIQNQKHFFITILPNDVLGKVCFVSRRHEDAEKGFQRMLNEARANDIAKYLDEFKGIIPSAIILSAQENAGFEYGKEDGKISFFVNARSFMVLDGQHRLYGLLKAKNTYQIPVIIFNGLDPSQEVNLFIDINTTQKGVPTTLLLDIKNLSGKETTKEERQRRLFDQLNKSGVLAGLLSPDRSQVGKITRVTFNQATNEIFESGFFQEKDDKTILKGVQNYLEAAEKVFKKSKAERAKLTNSLFFRALCSVFNEVVDKSLKEHSDLKVESFLAVLEPIARINYDVYTGNSHATFSKVVVEMKKELNEYERRYNELNNKDLF